MSFFNSIFNILRFNQKNWKAVVLCIFTATVFWFFNALNKDYTTTLSFPLAFDYDREAYIPVRPLPEVVRINVTGIGWNLFRRSAGVKVPPLVIPLERPGDVKKIVGSTLPGFFANQLGGFQINFVVTDTLRLAIEPRANRKVQVRLDIPPAFFKEGYVLVSPIQVVPDTILVEGPLSLVAALSDVIFLKIPQRNVDDNFREMLEVKFLNDGLIKRDPPTVDVSFQVDKLVEVSDSVKLKIINAPKNSWPFIERKKIPAKLSIPQTMINFYNTDSVIAVVDLLNVTKGRKKVMPVLQGLPPYSQVDELDSVVIKF